MAIPSLLALFVALGPSAEASQTGEAYAPGAFFPAPAHCSCLPDSTDEGSDAEPLPGQTDCFPGPQPWPTDCPPWCEDSPKGDH